MKRTKALRIKSGGAKAPPNHVLERTSAYPRIHAGTGQKVDQHDDRRRVMGINAQRETENGEALDTVPDPHSLLVRLVANERKDGICLRFVDPYGDTTFNQAQITVLVKEVQAAIERASDEEVKTHARKVLDLVKKAEGEPHTYVKFIGD